jgi:hypothetical protein
MPWERGELGSWGGDVVQRGKAMLLDILIFQFWETAFKEILCVRLGNLALGLKCKPPAHEGRVSLTAVSACSLEALLSLVFVESMCCHEAES